MSNKKLKLTRTKQCKYCPWKKDADLTKIPNYDPIQHQQLEKTIVAEQYEAIYKPIQAMACHCSTQKKQTFCVGWLHNQLGAGNNITLRLKMRNYQNISDLKISGEQYQTFNETLPK